MQDGLTEHFYRLTAMLKDMERFLNTLHKLNVITQDERRVIYSSMHFKCLEEFKTGGV